MYASPDKVLTMRSALIIAVLCFWMGQVYGQLPEWGNVFPQSEVTKIKIYIHPDSLNLLLSDDYLGNGHEFPASFVFESDGFMDSLANVGFRSRGNTSLQAAKKSFKVDFNVPLGVGKWQGLRELNLNGNHNDPSLMRAKLYWDLCRHFGLPGSRVSYTELYINGEYKGLYINVEFVDDLFTELYFNEKTGNRWKCLYPATLEYLGPNGADYEVLSPWGSVIYGLENNTQLNDFQDLADFIQVINNTPASSLPCELRKIFNVDRLLQYMAIDVMTGNWDGAHFNKNNFYLYQNDLTHRLEFLPYDTDNTFGIDWSNINWSTRNIYNWDGSANLVLYNKMMATAEFRSIYNFYIQSVANYMSSNDYTLQVESLQTMITPSALNDTYRTLDYGFDNTDFTNALDSAWGDHVTFGILEYINARVSSALSQLDNNIANPNLIYQVSSQVAGDAIHLSFKSTSNSPSVGYRIEGASNWNLLSANVVSSSIWDYSILVTLPLAGFQGTIEWQVVPAGQNLTANPCQVYVTHIGTENLGYFINEIAPNGTQGYGDAANEQNDWIEIYRAPGSIFLWNNIWITDNPRDPNKWKLHDININSGSFLTFWADDTPTQGNSHLNFKLNGDGEFVGISYWDNGDFHWLDSISFPAVDGLVSYARMTDGETPWQMVSASTPAASNVATFIEEPANASIQVYPNPAQDYFYWKGGFGKVYNNQGQWIANLMMPSIVETDQWTSGVYNIVSGNGVVRLVVIH